MTVDLDRVPALAADREKLWARVSAADFLTADEKKRVLGLGGLTVNGWTGGLATNPR